MGTPFKTLTSTTSTAELESSLNCINLNQHRESTKVKLFAEYLPRLSLLSLYVILSKENESASDVADENMKDLIKIFVACDSISIPFLEVGPIRFSGINFVEPQNSVQSAIALKNNVFYFRVITKPPAGSFGSAEAEFLPSSITSDFEDGMSRMLKYSRNHFTPLENVVYNISCQVCKCVFASNTIFKIVRQMPGLNWEEKATDLWCHPPCSSESDINNPQKTVFQMLSSPDPQNCYYSTTFYAVSPKVIQGISMDCKLPASCLSCKREVGFWYSSECIHLWDYGVIWGATEQQTGSTPSTLTTMSYNTKVFQNFKRSVFSSISEWSYSPMCQFLLKSWSQEDDSVLMWSTDKNLTIFRSEFLQKGLNSNSVLLTPEKVCKILYIKSPATGDNSLLDNPSSSFPVNSDCEVLSLPDSVFHEGMAKLKETSELYLSTNDELKCGFLAYLD